METGFKASLGNSRVLKELLNDIAKVIFGDLREIVGNWICSQSLDINIVHFFAIQYFPEENVQVP